MKNGWRPMSEAPSIGAMLVLTYNVMGPHVFILERLNGRWIHDDVEGTELADSHIVLAWQPIPSTEYKENDDETA